MPLSMKQKLQLMSFVSELSEPTATQELINKAVKRLGVSVTSADLKEACRNAEVKWSAVCGQSGSPVSVLHNRVTVVEAENVKLRTQLAEMKNDLNDIKHRIRSMEMKSNPLKLDVQ